MQRLEVSGAIRLIYRSLGVKGLKIKFVAPTNLLLIDYDVRDILIHLSSASHVAHRRTQSVKCCVVFVDKSGGTYSNQ